MVDKLFRNIVNQVRSGLLRIKSAQIKADDPLCLLPSVWEIEVRQRLRSLPYSDTYLTATATPILEAVTAWQKDLDAPNTLVVLGSPVDNTAAVLEAALTAERTEKLHLLRPLPWATRPADPLTIKAQLVQALTDLQAAEDDDDDDPDDLAHRRTVIVLPPLEQCFLRCIGGWQGVEWLRDTACAQQNYFWLIPCNTWAWAFLNRVCQVKAYFTQALPLPRIDGDTLCAWLTPPTEELSKPTSPGADAVKGLGDISWSTFAELCGGSPEVARSLWLQSLRLCQPDCPDQPQPLADKEAIPVPLHQVQPALPSLPDLESADHYVIHALMLHGMTTRSHLALSLGQPESIVQVRVQMLRQADLVRLSSTGLSLHPAYYPRFYNELDTNNFLTEEKLP